jgi:hypothetical protein
LDDPRGMIVGVEVEGLMVVFVGNEISLLGFERWS